jgi:hypothetical protein
MIEVYKASDDLLAFAKRHACRQKSYPFDQMEVGDAFTIMTADYLASHGPRASFQSMYGNVYQTSRRYSDRKFRLVRKRDPQNYKTVLGLDVVRVA